MPIGGSATEFNITGAKLKVSGGVQVSGSIAYTTDATGFGGVTAQIDGNNTLNVTSGKLTGVTKIERSTAATITAITHTNVNNNTTIHIALKNTSTTRGVFITLGTFASDDTVKVNYTDNYLIGPGETGMLTLRKVNGVLSLFAREMFSSKATSFDATDNSPFYIKDGVNYKYPLYKFAGTGLTSEVIQGTTYFRPTAGITTKSRPPKGLPENVTPPSASSFVIGNTSDLTTINYDVFGVSSNFDYASITDGNNATHARFLLTDGEASGSFTESGASSGDSYKLFIEKTNTNLTDTVTATSSTPSSPFAVFHHGTFANGGDPYSHGSVTAAATAGYFYSDTATGTYELGTLDETPTFVQETAAGGDGYGKTTYKFTTGDLTSVDHLLVAGGGGGGGDMGGGGGAGGYLETKNTTISAGQKTIVVGGGGIGGMNEGSYESRGRNGADTSVTGLTTAIGGGGGATSHNETNLPAGNGGSGGGGSGGRASNGSHGGERGTGTAGQGFDGARSGNHWYPAGGGGASEMGYGRDGTGGTNTTPHGGDGKQSTITGFTSYWFAGGGGGSSHSGNGGNGGKGGGGGGAPHSGSAGSGNTDGLTNGETGDDGTNSNTQEPPANTAGGAGGKHTGGGGGGGDHHAYNWGGVGGSGIVIIRTGGNITTGKTIPKVTDIVLDPTNNSNVLISTQGTGISTVTYSVNSGSEVSTPVSQLSVAHGLTVNVTGTLLAYALNASSARLGVKLSRSILPVYGYETFTITKHANASQNLTIVGNGTDNITSVRKSSGSNGWDTGFYTPTFTAPITFEFYKSAGSPNDNGIAYLQIGITDTPTVAAASGNMISNTDYYMYPHYTSLYSMGSGKGTSTGGNGTAWFNNKKHYIVYKTNGNVEFWNGDDLKKTYVWGTGKSVNFQTSHHINNADTTNQMRELRMIRREWDGTKYIN